VLEVAAGGERVKFFADEARKLTAVLLDPFEEGRKVTTHDRDRVAGRGRPGSIHPRGRARRHRRAGRRQRHADEPSREMTPT
jgi:hypothetical protein